MKILIVDDESSICNFIYDILSAEGHEVLTSYNGHDALEKGKNLELDLIFCDVNLGKINGFDVLRSFREQLLFKSEIVLMTGQATLEAALQASKLGANDYICKPFSISNLLDLVKGVEERIHIKKQTTSTDTSEFIESEVIIGRCPSLLNIFKILGRVASTDLSVLISGESGTGKELIARALHLNSLRASKPFVAINCGALTETLLETELFGHSKGAFTGALNNHTGLFEEAEGGTILLDEITETSIAFQVKLLRVLQEKEIRRVGSNQSRPINIRILATTNQDIEKLVANGTFRQDLMYRLNGISILLPPLRERGEDINLMLDAFLARYSPQNSPAIFLTSAAREALLRWNWPGNVREIRHTIQRLVALANGGIIRWEDLPEKIQQSKKLTVQSQNIPDLKVEELLAINGNNKLPSLKELEKYYVNRVLEHTNGNKTHAAEIIGVDRKTLSRMIERSI